MIKTAIVFDHRGRAQKDQEGPLEVRITANRRSYYISTGIRVRARDWKSGQYVHLPFWEEQQKRLDAVRGRIEEEVTRCVEKGLPIVAEEIKKRAWAKIQDDSDEQPFITWVEEQIARINVSFGTRKHYYTLVSRLRQYGKLCRWEDLTVPNILAFDEWLHQIKKPMKVSERMAGRSEQKISDDSVYNYHKTMKAMLHRALEFEKIETNPYERLQGRFRRIRVHDRMTYLTQEELALVEHVKPTPGSLMELVRDLFVFQAYTGLSYSDMQAFSIADYRKDGELWVHIGSRIKTGVPYTSVLLYPAVEVLEKYGMRIPPIPMQKYNLMLNALGQTIGLTKELHSHVARHTFATMMLAEGMKIENVSAMLGHTNIKQTQRYAKIVAESVKADVLSVSEKLRRKNGKK